jgi:hypothetical protein
MGAMYLKGVCTGGLVAIVVMWEAIGPLEDGA